LQSPVRVSNPGNQWLASNKPPLPSEPPPPLDQVSGEESSRCSRDWIRRGLGSSSLSDGTGLLLIEAQAHKQELAKEETGRKNIDAAEGASGRRNLLRIDWALRDANVVLADETGLLGEPRRPPQQVAVSARCLELAANH